MKTLYIDVYFLLNFTIDILAAFFTSMLLRIKTGNRRFILIGLLGAVVACVCALFDDIKPVLVIASAVFLFLLVFLSGHRITLIRRLRYVFVYFVFQLLIGGIVSYLYNKLDSFILKHLSGIEGGLENRRLVIISLIILLAIGVFRLFVIIFSSSNACGSVKLRIKMLERSVEAEAMIDTGNLVRDPLSSRPIVFIKEELALQLFPKNLIDLKDIDALEKGIKKRIRLIPVSRGKETHVYTGVIPDSVFVTDGENDDEIDLIVAIDKEEGTYNGYLALAPSVFEDYVN